MRWALGNFTLNINPNSNSKSWSTDQDIAINANGKVSNPNLIYKGSQQFDVDIYEPATHTEQTLLSGSYVGVTEKRLNERLYLLKNNGTFDVKGKDNYPYGSYTVVSGNGVTLPPVFPNSLSHFDSGLSFLYHQASSCQILITDENGNANRKYTYSSDDLKYGEYVCWDYSKYFIALNPYGKLYIVDTSTGASSFLYQFDDYYDNFSKSYKKYTSIFAMIKNGKTYVGILQDKNTIVFIDYAKLEIVCKSDIGINNIIGICNSNYSGDYYMISGSKLAKFYPNTCRIDIEQLKDIISVGSVKVTDELGLSSILNIKGMNISRVYNKNEARYTVQINGDISYNNIEFGNMWTNSYRNI